MTQPFETLVDLLERSTVKYAERPLFGTRVGDKFEWITYADFHAQVERCRGGLAALGVEPGDRVAIISSNRVEWAVAAYAIYGLRATCVPMYEAQKPTERQFILDDCGARVAFCSTAPIHEEVSRMRASLPSLERVIGFELPPEHPDAFAALLERGAGAPASVVMPRPSDVAGFIYTSGTTGKPKGVVLTHENLCSNISAVHQVFVFEPEDRSLSFLPWAHSFGQIAELHMLLSMGCSLALNDKLESLLDNLAIVKPSVLMAVPRIFNRIYEGVHAQMEHRPALVRKLFDKGIEHATERNHGERLGPLEKLEVSVADHLVFSKIRDKFGGHLKYAISASAALSPKVAEFIDALGVTVYEGYGLTETSPVVSCNAPGQRKIGSVGKPIPGVTVRIDRSVTGDAKEGEIVVYGPNVMKGYYRRDEENKKALTEDGGLRTGDLGYVDADGYLFITGRIKEQYKLENGKYVMPAPLEEELKLSPFISNAMLYGDNRPYNVALVVPDRQAVVAWAEHEGIEVPSLSSGAVMDLVTREVERIGESFRGFERPKRIFLVEEDFTVDNGLLTPTLKLKRHEVLSRYRPAIESLYEAEATGASPSHA